MISLVFGILCLVYRIDTYFNLSTLVTSSGRCVKSSDHCQPGNLSREWEERREQASTPPVSKRAWPQQWSKWLLSWARVKWGSQDYINLLFPNQLLQWDYHKHDGLDHLIQLDRSSGEWVNKRSQESCGLCWPRAAAGQALSSLLDLLLGTDRANQTHASDTRGVPLLAKYLPSQGKRVEMALVAISSLCTLKSKQKASHPQKQQQQRGKKMKLDNAFSYSCEISSGLNTG